MAAALVEVRPEATAATPVVEAAADQARGRGRLPWGGQKNRAASLCVAALKRRSRQARGQSRPVEAPSAAPPYPQRETTGDDDGGAGGNAGEGPSSKRCMFQAQSCDSR